MKKLLYVAAALVVAAVAGIPLAAIWWPMSDEMQRDLWATVIWLLLFGSPVVMFAAERYGDERKRRGGAR